MRAICFGTFDYLHPGHLSYFKQALKLADELVVIVARDVNVKKNKGHEAAQSEKIRLRVVRAALKQNKYPARAYLGGKVNPWLVLKKYQPDIICLGYDQKVDRARLSSEIKKFRLFCKLKRLRPYHPNEYKSSLIRAQRGK